MKRFFKSTKGKVITTIVVVPILAVFAFGIYLASLSGDLPWQTDPTRISENIAPFSGIPGFETQVPATSASPVSSTPTVVVTETKVST